MSFPNNRHGNTPPYLLSAYGIAVKHGYSGSEEEWLASLKGDQGEYPRLSYQIQTSGDVVRHGIFYRYADEGDWTNLCWLDDMMTAAEADIINAAKGYADTAEAYAKGTVDGEDVEEGDPGYEDNAKYYAGQASDSATAAAGSASDAASSAASALSYKNLATQQAQLAQTQAAAAANSANSAATAQNAAYTYAGSASTSASAAEAQATQAGTYAYNADQSAQQAASYAAAANTAYGNVVGLANGVDAKVDVASAAQTAAETAATNAANSATAASGSATSASGSATAAAGSATAAAGSASDAEAWAAGTRGGTPVESGDDAYHNNAAYYAGQAADVADSIPEDYSELSGDVADLMSASDLVTDAMVTSMGTTVSTTWQRYGYNANAITATNKRLMSTGTLTTQYITTDIKTLNIAISGNYWFSIQLWDDFVTPEDYSECTPIYNSPDWQKTDISFDLTPYPTAKTFTVLMRRSDNGTISTTAYVNLSISLKAKDNYYERVSTHASDSGYYAVNIIGEGETLARVKIPVTPNTEYKVSLPDNAWSLANTGDAAARWVFVVQDGETPSGEVLAGRRANEAYKNTYFVTPAEESINISIRATENVVVRLALMDTSKTNIVDYITNTAYGDNINSKYVGERPELLPNTYSYTILPGFAENGFTVISDYITEHFSVALNRQSIAVYGDYLVRGYNCGGIAIYDMHTGKLISDFMLPLSDEILTNFHCSNISFGNEFVNASDTFPLFYASETTGGKKGYVFQLTLSGAVLKQTIEFTGTWGTGNDYRDFIVDCYSGDMWIVGYYNYNVSGNYTICKKVPLPLLNAGTDIVYTDSDVLDSFTISDIRVIQGAFLRNGHLYIGDQRRYIDNISLTGKSIVGYIDLSSYTGELEGIAPYQGAFLVDLGTMYSFRLY